MADQKEAQDRESSPGTEPFVPDFDSGELPVAPTYDAGEPSVPFVPDFDTDSHPFLPLAGLAEPKSESPPVQERPAPVTPVATAAPDSGAESAVEAPGPVAVPGRYLYLKWWKFLLVLFGVWSFAAVFGLSLFYWWYHTIDKTPPVFATFGYVMACAAAGLILAMVESKPLVAALAIAVMSAPFASVAAAAPLYGSYYCERVTTPCVMGVVPQ
ncbi:MAG: hypothetical protein CK429_15975 [Mycobacterium sp.]|jgi:hypothetical protein|uniref:Transmembrane protein n=1 Tax=Mycobacterium gordonae TaxID=1778 RepID=A0A1A6BLD5_MYCGO|nr:hypothetical protein [Mycobacterium gordonae]MBX9980479.1 hypothetical protein [Mycobacterium gordonae]OBS03145.1 hypothetical protein A9W98_10960 [Mycobacterium gordonae]PJE12094.1 MAG: hypothetical protein CK429_15975 [Mycobacterium sp.]